MAPNLVAVQESLIATAGRAPSVHNTQPWRFRVAEDMVELRADPGRRLSQLDPDGRYLLVSCGAALFGLRLAVRGLGYRPVTELLPVPGQPEVLARVRLGAPVPLGPDGRRLLAAVRRRHTHRGPFSPQPLPAELPDALRADAAAEAAALVFLGDPRRLRQLARLVEAGQRHQYLDPRAAEEMRAWTRPAGSRARDGVPTWAYPAYPHQGPAALAQRDFDLGRGWGSLPATGPPPAATAVLTTAGDEPVDWLRAGQALHRVLLRAASRWVFASLHSQPLESPQIRAEIRHRLRLSGPPQMLLQLGTAHAAALTARRPASDVLGR